MSKFNSKSSSTCLKRWIWMWQQLSMATRHSKFWASRQRTTCLTWWFLISTCQYLMALRHARTLSNFSRIKESSKLTKALFLTYQALIATVFLSSISSQSSLLCRAWLLKASRRRQRTQGLTLHYKVHCMLKLLITWFYPNSSREKRN